MEKRTAEIVMVLKGNSNLFEGINSDAHELMDKYMPKNIEFVVGINMFYTIALYMSDVCNVPVSFYYEHPFIVAKEMHKAAVDYMKTCDNPSYCLWQYFDEAETDNEKNVFNDILYWGNVFINQQVREHDRDGNLYYINGFTEENTQEYKRQRPYFEDFENMEK